MAIDDPIDAARQQIEYGKTSVAPQVVTKILDGLAILGVKQLKPAAWAMGLVFAKREDNVAYLLDATILKLRALEAQVKAFSESHRRFVDEQFPGLLLEAVSKAERTSSKERIERLSLIVVHTVVKGPEANLDEADEMMRLTLDLGEEDIDVLNKIYVSQAQSLGFLNFMPEQNVANSSWKLLQDQYPSFKSSRIYSVCAKLQSYGLITQVPRIATMLDLSSLPYAILQKGADYLDAIGRRA